MGADVQLRKQFANQQVIPVSTCQRCQFQQQGLLLQLAERLTQLVSEPPKFRKAPAVAGKGHRIAIAVGRTVVGKRVSHWGNLHRQNRFFKTDKRTVEKISKLVRRRFDPYTIR